MNPPVADTEKYGSLREATERVNGKGFPILDISITSKHFESASLTVRYVEIQHHIFNLKELCEKANTPKPS